MALLWAVMLLLFGKSRMLLQLLSEILCLLVARRIFGSSCFNLRVRGLCQTTILHLWLRIEHLLRAGRCRVQSIIVLLLLSEWQRRWVLRHLS